MMSSSLATYDTTFWADIALNTKETIASRLASRLAAVTAANLNPAINARIAEGLPGRLRRMLALADGASDEAAYLTALRHNIALMDQLRSDLDRGDGILVLVDGSDIGDTAILRRLIDGIRAILRLVLIRVLSGLSRCPDTINAILVLLAASRRYGLRSEPSDYTLPVLTPKSVVIGEVARL